MYAVPVFTRIFPNFFNNFDNSRALAANLMAAQLFLVKKENVARLTSERCVGGFILEGACFQFQTFHFRMLVYQVLGEKMVPFAFFVLNILFFFINFA